MIIADWISKVETGGRGSGGALELVFLCVYVSLSLLASAHYMIPLCFCC